MITTDRFTTIALTMIVWGLAGGVFGALFSGLHGALAALGLSGWQVPMAAAGAAATFTSAVYSAMPVALTGAMGGVLASIGALIVMGHYLDLSTIALSAAVAGLAAGSFYAWMAESGAGPLLETLAGLASGVAAGALVSLIAGWVDPAGAMFVLAAGVVALVGTLFQVSQRWLAGLRVPWIPGTLAGAVVGSLVAVLVGFSMWILVAGGGLLGDDSSGDTFQLIGSGLLPGFLGGMTGGAITGVILELLGFHLEEHGSPPTGV